MTKDVDHDAISKILGSKMTPVKGARFGGFAAPALKLLRPEPIEYEAPTTFRCPACGHTDTPDGFDVMGADDDHVFCLKCGEEFDPAEGE